MELDLGRKLNSVQEEFTYTAFPHGTGLVVREHQEDWILEAMNYSLVPYWSKERKPKFASYNARVEGIESKPTWRGPFCRRRCVVPISHFTESSYSGPLRGHILDFQNAGSSVLWAAGVWDEWVDPSSGEILRSFAIITRKPYAYVEENGHDRSPLFLSLARIPRWLDSQEKEAQALLSLLEQETFTPQIVARINRPMKAGWEKRQ